MRDACSEWFHAYFQAYLEYFFGIHIRKLFFMSHVRSVDFGFSLGCLFYIVQKMRKG